jgi:putative ABC transport system permease protein
MNVVIIALKNIFRNKRRTVFTIFSIVIGITALILFEGYITYSMWGLKNTTIRNGIGHLQISSDEKYFLAGSFNPYDFLIEDSENVRKKMMRLPEIKAIVPQISISGTLGFEDKSGIIQAYPAEAESSLLSFRKIIKGRDLLSDDSYHIVLSKGVAEKIEADIGSYVTLMASTLGGGVNAADFEVIGISSSGLRELDNIYTYINLETAKEFLFVDDVPIFILMLEKEVYLDHVYYELTEGKTAGRIGTPLAIKKWDELADYYKSAVMMYSSLLSVVRIIILLIVIFSIVNTMTMSVFERIKEIGTLRSLGTKKARILLMFILEGTGIGIIGGTLGIVAGFCISWLLNASGGIYIPPPPGMSEGYYSLFTPEYKVIWENLILATILSSIGSMYPAFKAIRFNIAEALRYV